MSLRIPFVRLHEKAVIPSFATTGAAGADLYSVEDVMLFPGKAALVSTGLAVAVPTGYELQVRPRSGLALKHGIAVLNSPGTIDSDFRGTVGVILANLGTTPFAIKAGDRIAQAVVSAVPQVSYAEVDQLDETERGTGGFGSTGRN